VSAATLDTLALAVVLGVCGAIVGSFMTVVVDRGASQRSVVRGRSHCPSCGIELSAIDLVPILSWIWLRGRCRRCAASIPTTSLVVETLGVAVPVTVVVGRGASAEAAVLAVVSTAVVMAAFVDAVRGVLPNRVLAVVALVETVGFSALALVGPSWDQLGRAVWAGAGAFAAALVVYLVTRGALGEGDVKFAPLVFLPLGWLGWSAVFAGYLVTAATAAVIAVVASVRARRRIAVPFGPAMAAGVVVTVMTGFRWPP